MKSITAQSDWNMRVGQENEFGIPQDTKFNY